MNARNKWMVGTGVLVAAGALVPVLAHDPHEAPSAMPFDLNSPRHPSEQTAKYIGLETAEVDFGMVQRVVRLTGTVRAMPERQHVVTSAVAGTLTKLDVRIGDRVKKGQAIGEIQSAELARMVNELHKAEIDFEHAASEETIMTSNIAQLRAQVAGSEAQAKLLEDEVARLEAGGEAVGSNVLSAKRAAVLQQRSQVATLSISLEQGQRTLVSLGKMKESTGKSIAAMRDVIEIIHSHPAGIDLAAETKAEGESGGTFLLHAQIDGVVTRREAVLGQGVEPGKVIVTIADFTEVLIEGELPESMMSGWGNAVGAEVRIRRPGSPTGDAPIAVGQVKGVSPTVDPIKRTAHLLIVAKNPPGSVGMGALQEGMFVSLAVTEPSGGGSEQMVVVPAGAVVSDGPMPFVFVKDKDAYVKKDIVPGARDDRMVEVKEGLVPGDVVVTHGAYLLTQLRPAGGAGAGEDEHHHHH